MKERANIIKFSLIVAAAFGITIFAVRFSCEIYRVFPLYVSLVVMFLQTRASRFSFLLGGCNAAYYGIVYFFLDLYGMALYSLFVACPIQIITYLRWKKRAYAHSAVLKRLTTGQRLWWVLGSVAVWLLMYYSLRSFGSEYIILDNSAAVIAAVANLASLLYLIEFPYIQSVSHILNLSLCIQMIQTDPKQWTFLLYTVYALICAVLSAVYMQKLYNLQKKENII